MPRAARKRRAADRDPNQRRRRKHRGPGVRARELTRGVHQHTKGNKHNQDQRNAGNADDHHVNRYAGSVFSAGFSVILLAARLAFYVGQNAWAQDAAPPRELHPLGRRIAALRTRCVVGHCFGGATTSFFSMRLHVSNVLVGSIAIPSTTTCWILPSLSMTNVARRPVPLVSL